MGASLGTDTSPADRLHITKAPLPWYRYLERSSILSILMRSPQSLDRSPSPQGRRRLRGVMLDMTEQKRAEQALGESEERFRATFEQAAVGMAHVAVDGTFLRLTSSPP